MAKPEWGVKRVCPECATRFYDLTRDPATCPKCGASFSVELLGRAKPVKEDIAKASAAKAAKADEDALVDDDDLIDDEAMDDDEEVAVADGAEDDDLPDLDDDVVLDGDDEDDDLESGFEIESDDEDR